jgi:hypothetical protein
MLAALFAMRDPSIPPSMRSLSQDVDGGDRLQTPAPRPATRADWVSRPLSDAARAVLNEPSEWEPKRAPLRASDQMIHPHTQDWLRALPGSRWPMNLASRYPRIANHLALVWPDAVLCGRTFDRLLNDERGGRQGFPDLVRAELVALRRLRVELSHAEAPRAPWGGLRLVDATIARASNATATDVRRN